MEGHLTAIKDYAGLKGYASTDGCGPSKVGNEGSSSARELLCSDNRKYLLFDGDCPFCSRYLKYIRARTAFKGLELRDARLYPELVEEWHEKGYHLNNGMLLVLGDQVYFADDAIHALALASTRLGLLNRLNSVMMAHGYVARLSYPLLRVGRRVALRVLRRPPL